MKRYLLFFATILTFPLTAYPQISNSSTDWNSGIVILNNKEIVKGAISYDYARDIVMCKENETIRTFSPHQVSSFKYFDEAESLFHDFVTLGVEVHPSYQHIAFYELVLEGDINYVRKRNRFPAIQAKEGYLALQNSQLNEHKVCYEYFVHYNDQLIKARRFKKEVLPLMKSKEKSIQAFMKANHLRPYDIGDQIELVEYYNDISGLSKQTANLSPKKHNQFKSVVD